MTRAVAIEFRSKKKSSSWRSFWDTAFFLTSLLAAFDLSLLLGNLIQGLPICNGHIQARFVDLFTPYPLLTAVFGVSLFIMHGNIYLLMKTEGDLHDRLFRRSKKTIIVFIILWLATTWATFKHHPKMIESFVHHPSLLSIALLSLLSIGSVPYFLSKKKNGLAFLASSCCIGFLFLLFIIGTFPYFMHAPDHHSLTLYNSSSTKMALMILSIVALTGLPLAFFYGGYIYRVFRGKIILDHTSY